MTTCVNIQDIFQDGSENLEISKLFTEFKDVVFITQWVQNCLKLLYLLQFTR